MICQPISGWSMETIYLFNKDSINADPMLKTLPSATIKKLDFLTQKLKGAASIPLFVNNKKYCLIFFGSEWDTIHEWFFKVSTINKSDIDVFRNFVINHEDAHCVFYFQNKTFSSYEEGEFYADKYSLKKLSPIFDIKNVKDAIIKERLFQLKDKKDSLLFDLYKSL